MKKAILFFYGALLFGVVWWLMRSDLLLPTSEKTSTPKTLTPVSTTIPTAKANLAKSSLFVPYWTMGNEKIQEDGIEQYIYFGITYDKEGKIIQDQGYKNAVVFLKKTDNSAKKLLAIRLTDQKINSSIVENYSLQKTIAKEAVGFAKANGFDGIVLDFEINALAFDSVIKGISNFYKLMYEEGKEKELEVFAALYGDVFYRARPYDVKAIATFTDGIFIMAYDFHKARGNPGPNFPLLGKEHYGYDFYQMIDDYTKNVPKQKLSIIFGLFGYDWEVNEKNETITGGIPLSTNEIAGKFIQSCEFANCKVNRDQTSGEMRVVYRNEDKMHVVWFEDMESVRRKREIMEEKGITSFGYWAYSYF